MKDLRLIAYRRALEAWEKLAGEARADAKPSPEAFGLSPEEAAEIRRAREKAADPDSR